MTSIEGGPLGAPPNPNQAFPTMPWLRARSYGVFLEPARRFLADAESPNWQTPMEAIRWLCRRVDSFRGAQEDAFIDGAGSMLACLLLHQWPDTVAHSSSGRHRVVVGHQAQFDPFAIVIASLQSGNARSHFEHALTRFEKELDGLGPVSTTQKSLEEILKDRIPDALIEERTDFRVRIRRGDESIELDMARAVELADDSPEAMQRALERAVEPLAASSTQTIFDPNLLEKTCPRLCANAFVEVRKHLATGSFLDLCKVALVEPEDKRVRYVRAKELDALNCDFQTALVRSLQNLEQRSLRFRMQPGYEIPNAVMVRVGDGFDAARILLPSVRAHLLQTLGEEELVAAIPHRDLLLIGRLQQTSELRAFSQDQFMRAPHGITPDLLFFGLHSLATQNLG